MRGKFRWWIVCLLFAGTALNYVDRNVLSVLEPKIRLDIGWTPEQWGMINGSFWLAYAAFALLTGRLLDRVGTRLGYALILGWWGLACALHGLAGSVLAFAIFRFILGVGEAGVAPATAKATAEWFPKSERGLAFGLAMSGTMLGGVIAPPLTGIIAVNLGWQAAFFFAGGLCALWVAGWIAVYNQPAKHKRITEEERQYVLSSQAAEDAERGTGSEDGVAPIGLFRLVRLPQMWGLALAKTIADPVWAFFLAWTPKYLSEVRGVDFKTIAYTTWLPFAASALGSISSGWISTVLIKRGMNVITARKVVIVAGAALMPIGSLAFYAKSLEAAFVCLCVAGFGHVFWVTAVQTLPSDIFPSRQVGTATGLIQTTGSIGNVLGLYGVGYLVSHLSYKPVFLLAGFMHPIGAIIVLATVRNMGALAKWLRAQNSSPGA